MLKKNSCLWNNWLSIYALALPVITILVFGCTFFRVTFTPANAIAVTSDRFTLVWSSADSDNTHSLEWGDYDNDGDLDLMAANSYRYVSRLYRNDSGSFAAAPTWVANQTTTVGNIGSGAWADVDLDGDLDWAVALHDGYLRFYRNSGGIFSHVQTLSVGGSARAVTWADMDGDRYPEIAVGTQYGLRILKYQNNVLVETAQIGSYDFLALDWGDVDNDGKLDLLAGTNVKNYLFKNNNGTLSSTPAWQSALGVLANSVAWGDVNKDGYLDAATANSSADCSVTNPARVYQNQNGVLSTTSSWSPSQNGCALSVSWVDYDQDEDPDLLVVYGDENPLRLFQNDNGVLSSAPVWVGGVYTDAIKNVSWGDYDNDGDLDMAVANYYGPNRIYRNNGNSLPSTSGWASSTAAKTNSVALGDVDNDGDLDLAVGNQYSGNQVFLNNQGVLSTTPAWTAQNAYKTRMIAWGDVENDGDLDLAVANEYGPAMLFLNLAGTLQTTPAWSSQASLGGNALAWGDYDNDGDLDLVVGNGSAPTGYYGTAGKIHLFENVGGSLSTQPVWTSSEDNSTISLAWGDMDNDGDLDLATANWQQPARVYTNQEGVLNPTAAWAASFSERSTGAAWGDYDADGNLDLAIANDISPNRVYRNLGGILDINPSWTSLISMEGRQVVWGDLDNEGYLDLAIGMGSAVNISYQNTKGVLSNTASWSSIDSIRTHGIALGDVDLDGDLDAVTGNGGTYDAYATVDYPVRIYFNSRDQHTQASSNPIVRISNPVVEAQGYASPKILGWPDLIIPIQYTLVDAQSDKVSRIQAWYSLNGGGKWYPAFSTQDTVTTDLSTSPTGITYTYKWDLAASNFFGKSDNVVFRIQAIPELKQQANSVPGPFMYGSYSSSSTQFRARGTQIQVLQNGSPVKDAMVYRIPKGQSDKGKVISDITGKAYNTDGSGYLQGFGTITTGDRLAALFATSVPVDSPCAGGKCGLYATSLDSALPDQGLKLVTSLGLQQLEVKSDHPLLLFNLNISLQWDARADDTFLADLSYALGQTSNLLYDVSNGQVALGDIKVYQNREHWLDSDVVIYAQNGIRPRATMGGMVTGGVDDIGFDTQGYPHTIVAAYTPGQVRMGPNWDPFGTNLSELKLDWQRALAHELSHYLLFLPDNYIGIENNLPIQTDCLGSFMTSTYDSAYSEFLPSTQWSGDCLKTMAQFTTQRADWDTIKKFYSFITVPSASLEGPFEIPLDLLKTSYPDPVDSNNKALPPAFTSVYYDIRSSGTLQSIPGAQVYLFKTLGTDDLSDDTAILLGDTVGASDRIKVRGTEAGDRICVYGPYDRLSNSSWTGCKSVTNVSDRSISVTKVSGWHPSIKVESIASQTFRIWVDLAAPLAALNVQVFPAYGGPDGKQPSAKWQAMTASDNTNQHFVTDVVMDAPAYEGIARVWDPNNSSRESISPFYLSPPWGPNNIGAGMGGDKRAWGANNRALGAPVASGDGQVSIFNLLDIFSDTGTVSLQAVPSGDIPGLPIWLTPVGQAYRFVPSIHFPRVITFDYLQRDVPAGYEHTLHIYYQADGSTTWQQLETQLNMTNNRATATMPVGAVDGKGIYSLIATVEMPALSMGWNQFGYPIPGSRPIQEALASIQNSLVTVVTQDSVQSSWHIYDQKVISDHPEYAGLINDLTNLEFGKVYWLNSSGVAIPYLGVPDLNTSQIAPTSQPLSPAIFYGPIQGAEIGSAVETRIGNQLCGQGQVMSWNGQPTFRVEVKADENDGCGTTGRAIMFSVNHKDYGSVTWDNTHAQYALLEQVPPTLYYMFLPFSKK